MPIYEFACERCETLFSFFSRRVNTSAVPACPKCAGPLSKRVSLFKAMSSKERPAGEWCAPEDDGEYCGVPDFDTGDERVAGAISELGDRIDRLDPNDSAAAARTMKEFSQRSGMEFSQSVKRALERIASGDESASAKEQLEEALSRGNPFDTAKGGDGGARAPFKVDPTLYDM